MSSNFAAPGRGGAYGGSVAEVFVLCAMAFATLAVGTAMTQQFGLDFWVASSAALALYFALLAIHAVARRRMVRPAIERTGQHSHRRVPKPQGPREPVFVPSTGQSPSAPEPTALPHDQAAQTANGFDASPVGRRSLPVPGGHGARLEMTETTPALLLQRTAGPSVLPTAATPLPTVSPREADVEMLQALIRKLADEVNAAEASVARGHVPVAQPERAIGQSVEALRTAAGSLRAMDDDESTVGRSIAGLPPPVLEAMPRTASTELGSAPTPSAVDPQVALGGSLAAEAGAALSAGRIDLLLQPILDLGSHRPRHFEVSVRLRDAAGEPIDLVTAAREAGGSSLLSRVEAAGVARTAQFAIRLDARGRNDQLFSPVSGASIAEGPFLDEVADAYRQRETFAGQLVMTFAQADVRGFGERHWSTLADLADLGFRFGIAAVTDLDMDFEELKAQGFDFVKLDAGVFLEGLPLGQAVIPAADVTRHLAGLGLATIVGHIDDEAVAGRVLGFGVLFGQGLLFGAPRPVRPEVLENSGAAAA